MDNLNSSLCAIECKDVNTLSISIREVILVAMKLVPIILYTFGLKTDLVGDVGQGVIRRFVTHCKSKYLSS